MDTEHVFKALADHHRRRLLDSLARDDGQTLGELCAQLPMTRIGVMKHLHVLEAAGLITTRKVGREKRHYLNPAPLQTVADWAAQFRTLRAASFDRLEELLRAQQHPQIDEQSPPRKET